MTRFQTAASGAVMKNVHAPILGLITSVLVFLTAQLLFSNALYGLPLLLPLVVLLAANGRSLWWNIATALISVLAYYVLDRAVNAGPKAIPWPLLTLCAASMAATAAVAGRQASRMLAQVRLYSEQSAMETLISDINTHLLSTATTEELSRLTLHHLYNVSQCPSTFYICDDGGALCHIASYPAGLLLFPTEAAAAQAALELGAPTGFDTRIHSSSAFRYLPLKANDSILGVVGILVNVQAPPDQRMMRMLQQMLLRVAVALEKQRLAARHQHAIIDKELERMRSDFLRAISHDFRTPLTAIIGACSALTQDDMALDASVRRELIANTEKEAQWLLRMVENLLSVTRADSGGPALKRSLEPLEEVLSSTLIKAQGRFPHISLYLQQPDTFLMIPMDPMLIMQVLMNLIENAVKYAPQSNRIDLIVTATEQAVHFTVRDYGQGITDRDPESLFLPMPTVVGASAHGMGMGLSICRSVIRAHNGDITAENCPDGGSAFSFTLPREEST